MPAKIARMARACNREPPAECLAEAKPTGPIMPPMKNALQVLQDVFGYAAFRGPQQEIIDTWWPAATRSC